MKKTQAGIYVADEAEELLPVGGVKIEWDADIGHGIVEEIITRGPLEKGGENQPPVIVKMQIADVLELAATLQLQSLAYLRGLQKKGKGAVAVAAAAALRS